MSAPQPDVPLMTALVADDEPLARSSLRALLEESGRVRVVGEAADGTEALERVEAAEPDLLFLDVHMPGLSGMEVLRRLDAEVERPPVVVLTTAYDQYALSAYELGALDYLLKPFGPERLARALDRVRPLVAAREAAPLDDRFGGLLGDRRAVAAEALEGGPLERLFVRERGRILQVRAADIVRLEAQGDYALVHTAAGARHLAYLSLNEFEARLDARTFARIHRSHIANLDYVRALLPYDPSRLAVEFVDGTCVVASRMRSKLLRRIVH